MGKTMLPDLAASLNTATHFLPVNLPDLVTSETLFPQDTQEFPVWFSLVGLLSVTILQMNISGPDLCPLSLVTAYMSAVLMKT